MPQEHLPTALETEGGAAAAKAFAAQHEALQTFVAGAHAEWRAGLAKGLAERMKQPLLSQARVLLPTVACCSGLASYVKYSLAAFPPHQCNS